MMTFADRIEAVVAGVVQSQVVGDLTNNAAQTATATDTATSASGLITNTAAPATIEAGEDALVSKSVAEAGSEIGQWLSQKNDNYQGQTAGDERPLSLNRRHTKPSTSSSRSRRPRCTA